MNHWILATSPHSSILRANGKCFYFLFLDIVLVYQKATFLGKPNIFFCIFVFVLTNYVMGRWFNKYHSSARFPSLCKWVLSLFDCSRAFKLCPIYGVTNTLNVLKLLVYSPLKSPMIGHTEPTLKGQDLVAFSIITTNEESFCIYRPNLKKIGIGSVVGIAMMSCLITTILSGYWGYPLGNYPM